MNTNKCLKWRNKCWHFTEFFPFQKFSFLVTLLAPLNPSSTTTWNCVFSVKKDFSLYARFVLLVKGWTHWDSYLQALEMIYCEKYPCWKMLHYARHRLVEFTHLVSVCCSSLRHMIRFECVKHVFLPNNGRHIWGKFCSSAPNNSQISFRRLKRHTLFCFRLEQKIDREMNAQI